MSRNQSWHLAKPGSHVRLLVLPPPTTALNYPLHMSGILALGAGPASSLGYPRAHVYLSMHPSIYLSIYLSTHLSISPSVHVSP